MRVRQVIISVTKQLKSFITKKENWPYLFFFLCIFTIFLVNSLHESYPDEFDNILGGWYIIHGLPIYDKWFTHHGPVAYFIAAFIEIFTRNSFVAFRLVYALVLFLLTTGCYIYLRRKFGEVQTRFYLLFIFFLAIMGNYYWLHMLLADSLSAYLFAPIFALLLLATLYKRELSLQDVTFISLGTALSLLSSLTYTYIAFIVYGYTLFYYLFFTKGKLISKKNIYSILIIASPYLVFVLYLLATGSLTDYLTQGISFNQKYYIYNYPRPEGTTFINPIRFAVVIANNFYNSYFALLQQLPSLNVFFPLNITMAVGSISLVIYLVVRRYYLFSGIMMALILYANARSNPLTSGERDYQSAVYIVLSFLAISFLLSRLPKFLAESKDYGEKILLGGIFAILTFYTVFSTGFFFQKFFNRTYEKYMGKMALIYDRPHIAPFINSLIEKNEPVWIGPFNFEELFYTHGKPATKYQILIPGMGSSPEMQKEMLTELSVSRPRIIYFQSNFGILGRSPDQYGGFFKDFLKANYIRLGDYISPHGESYKSLIPIDEWMDIEQRLYIRKDVTDEMIKKMLEKSYIEKLVKE